MVSLYNWKKSCIIDSQLAAAVGPGTKKAGFRRVFLEDVRFWYHPTCCKFSNRCDCYDVFPSHLRSTFFDFDFDCFDFSTCLLLFIRETYVSGFQRNAVLEKRRSTNSTNDRLKPTHNNNKRQWCEFGMNPLQVVQGHT